MEILVLGIIFAVIFLAVRSKPSKQRNNRSPEPKPRSQPQSSGTPPAKMSTGQPPGFEEESARHLHEKRILTGSAYITDGDTIRIKKTQIRLFGIDAPEMNHPYGKKAKWALHKLCKGQIVRAEIVDEDDH